MAKLRFDISMSLDGFTAGRDQSQENPLGVGGTQLHQWLFSLAAWRARNGLAGGEVSASTEVFEAGLAGVGAVIMGRNMFGGGPGPWGEVPWNGWWGDDPPFHLPVFVLTHHPREPLVLGGSSFTFVTEGVASALGQAMRAARGDDVWLAGGANVARQFLAAGLVDEMLLHVVPVLLGAGARLFEDMADREVKLEQLSVVPAPGVTHLGFRLVR